MEKKGRGEGTEGEKEGEGEEEGEEEGKRKGRGREEEGEKEEKKKGKERKKGKNRNEPAVPQSAQTRLPGQRRTDSRNSESLLFSVRLRGLAELLFKAFAVAFCNTETQWFNILSFSACSNNVSEVGAINSKQNLLSQSRASFTVVNSKFASSFPSVFFCSLFCLFSF